MVEQINKDLYRIGVPLPGNPLKELNSYVLLGKKRNLIVDTGFNMPTCKEAMNKGIMEIGIPQNSFDLFITHVHSDHCGLVKYLSGVNNKVYCSNYTSYAFNGSYGNKVLYGYFNDMVVQSGLPMMELDIHPGIQYAPETIGEDNIIIIRDKDVINLGDWKLQFIMTTGHAPEHVCLYDKKRKILFSGDHILDGITPNNTVWSSPWRSKKDLLGEYLANLDKIDKLEIDVTYPAHRNKIIDTHGRIGELKDHHAKRLNSILAILGKSKMNGVEVASKMQWDLRGQTWGNFNIIHKLFATGEALSHLVHLVCLGVLKEELYDGIVYYSKLN
ncbi:MBL fold metallo-hydrolase [Pectinatus frisingensis]|uniref:MBL fold metallo-hydrolase n=1 Tax=Pectinatus frisingensis TaxID=865 RepID=UPI0015F7067C|nr:MBL fold metallo-hydrolase [Pectinatus frisingensis]